MPGRNATKQVPFSPNSAKMPPDMQSTRILPLAAAAAVAGALGYYAGRQSEPPAAGISADGKIPEARNTSAVTAQTVPRNTLPASLTKLRGDDPLTASNATALTFRALEESDPVTRMAATTLLLESMTPENALAIRQAFLDITTQTGRQSPAEWALMVQRCGTVLGSQALKVFASDKHNSALAIEGFASVDPDGALAALKTAGLEGAQMTRAWLAGVCRKDPQKALTLALSGDHDGVNAGALLNQAIQSAGIEGAREALQRALDTPPGDAVTSAAFPEIFSALAKALAHKYTTNGTPGEMLKWLEQQKDQPHLSDGLLSDAAYDNLLKGDPAGTVAWLERMNTGKDGSPAGTARLFDAVVTDPKILSKLDDASFARLLPFMEKDLLRLQVLAAMVEETNPGRAKQIRAAMPAAPAPPAPVPSAPVPDGGE